MCEQYRNIGRALFYSLTTHTRQHCTMCDNKSAVPAFTRWQMIVYLYDSSILDTYSLVFARQSKIATPSTKAKAINKMTCLLLFVPQEH